MPQGDPTNEPRATPWNCFRATTWPESQTFFVATVKGPAGTKRLEKLPEKILVTPNEPGGKGRWRV